MLIRKKIIYCFLGFILIFFVNKTNSSIADSTLDIVKRFLSDSPTILEAGTGSGGDTVRLAKFWPGGVIHAFEPHPEMFASLQKKSESFSNIKIYNLALSDQVGTAEFWVSSNHPVSSSLLEKDSAVSAYPWLRFEKEPICVECATIDRWAELNDVENIDFMWLDMEGYELFALKASPKILNTVKVIQTEVNFVAYRKETPLYKDFKRWLESRGFVEVWLLKVNRIRGDAIFVRTDLIN